MSQATAKKSLNISSPIGLRIRRRSSGDAIRPRTPPRRATIGPKLGLQDLLARLGCGTCRRLGLRERRPYFLVDRVQLRLVHAMLDEPGSEPWNRIAREP